MDLTEALLNWTKLGYTWIGWDTKEAHWILFVKNDTVVGHVKTVAGSISWELPDELFMLKD